MGSMYSNIRDAFLGKNSHVVLLLLAGLGAAIF